MTTETPAANETTTKATKKAVKKAAPAAATKKVAKKAVKKVAKAATKKAAKEETGERGPNKTQLAVLAVLARTSHPLTRAQISEKMDHAFIGGKVMGHKDPNKLTESSLVGRGLAAFAPAPAGQPESAVYYTITPAGRKAIGK